MPSAVKYCGDEIQCKKLQKVLDFISSDSAKARLEKAQEKSFENVEAACAAMITVYLELFGEANKQYNCPLEIRDMNNSIIQLKCKTCKIYQDAQVLTLTYGKKGKK